MRKLSKLFTLGAIILALVSCGKENASGGGDSTTSTTTITSSGTNYTDFSTMRSAYQGIALNSGLSVDMPIYHVGSAFGASSYSGSFDFSFCVSLFGYTSDGCSSSSNSQLGQIISQGEYKVIDSMSASQVNISVASDYDNYGFLYDSKVFDRNDDYYLEMLNLDGRSVRKIVISKANVTLSTGGTINADYVEYFYNDGSVNGYVLSTAFPILANPLAITENYSFTGALKLAGSKSIRSISVTTHQVVYSWSTNAYTSQAYVTRSVSL